MFAGGMARSGEACGAVAGSLMAIGIKHGRDDLRHPEVTGQALGARMVQAFRDEMGALRCRDLTGHDLSTPESLKAFRKSDVRMTVCLRAVGFAYETTLKLLRE